MPDPPPPLPEEDEWVVVHPEGGVRALHAPLTSSMDNLAAVMERHGALRGAGKEREAGHCAVSVMGLGALGLVIGWWLRRKGRKTA